MFNKLMALVVSQPNCTLDVRDRNIMIENYSGKKVPVTEIGFKDDCFGVFVGDDFYPWQDLKSTETMAIYRVID
jgi:hypothetical protein